MKLTKRDLVLQVAEEARLTQLEAHSVVQHMLDRIADCLVKGHNVEFRDFGVFSIQRRKPRIGRNPNRPKDEVMIPDRKTVKFKAGRALRARLANPPAKPLAAARAR